MKMIYLLSILFSSQIFAYTLNNNFGAGFKDSDVEVNIDAGTTCVDANITAQELRDLIDPAVERFWNRVPTSKLRLKFGEFSTAVTNINTGILCAPTDDKCISDAGANVIAPVKDIVIACNNNIYNFKQTNVLAVTIPNNFSGKKINGSVILINNMPGSAFADLSKSDKIGVIAHEIGHAFGLGHTDDKAALMYYRTVNQRKALGEDDMRGVSFLYPMQLDAGGLLGGCGTIQQIGTPPTNPPYWPMGISLGLLILIFEARKLFARARFIKPLK